MTTPRLATTRPAALTGTIGQGGVNRIHDVALVQALLGAKRDRRSRPYLRDHVTGGYDKFTAEALMRYRMDQRDASIKRPFARSGPMLNKLAQGQALAVPEGTAIPYQVATLAEPGPIEGPIAALLSAERKVALKEVMKDFARDWGIAFDVEIKPATNSPPARTSKFVIDYESLPLMAHFTPRNLSVRLPRGLSVIPSNAQFRAKAKALYELVEADLKARCAQAFGITDPVDVKIQNGLKGDLACVVRTDLEGVEALAQFLLALGRKFGLQIAVRFFERYLRASGESMELNRDEAMEFALARNGTEENIERFKQKTFVAPAQSNKAHLGIEAISTKPDVPIANVHDDWDLNFTHDTIAGISRLVEGVRTDFQDTIAAILGPGRSTLTSTGDFLLQREGNRVQVAGAIVHVWTDPAYDFDPGRLFYEEAQILERHNKAKPFQWETKWEDGVLGEFEIDNLFSPNATRRWTKFELNRIS